MVRAETVYEVWERFPSAEDMRPQHPADTAARMAHVSTSTLRRYEAAGVLLPHHNGHQLYCDDDVRWMRCIHCLLHTWGLTLEKLRRLLSTVDCAELTYCPPQRHAACPFPGTTGEPCWVMVAAMDNRQCYACPVYRLARYRICGPAEIERAQSWTPEP